MQHNLSADQLRAIVGALEGGSKIKAVKLYREATGLSLSESLKGVEAIPFSHALPPPPPNPNRYLTPRKPEPSGLTPEKLAEVMAAIQRKEKIEAIRLYREATALGLAESKKAVEAMESSESSKHGAREISSFPERTPLPRWDPFAEKKNGCLGMIAILVALAVSAVVSFF